MEEGREKGREGEKEGKKRQFGEMFIYKTSNVVLLECKYGFLSQHI